MYIRLPLNAEKADNLKGYLLFLFVEKLNISWQGGGNITPFFYMLIRKPLHFLCDSMILHQHLINNSNKLPLIFNNLRKNKS
jgi:hypothetical protein